MPGTTPRTRPESSEGDYLSLLERYSVSDEPITAWPDSRFIER